MDLIRWKDWLIWIPCHDQSFNCGSTMTRKPESNFVTLESVGCIENQKSSFMSKTRNHWDHQCNDCTFANLQGVVSVCFSKVLLSSAASSPWNAGGDVLMQSSSSATSSLVQYTLRVHKDIYVDCICAVRVGRALDIFKIHHCLPCMKIGPLQWLYQGRKVNSFR